MTAKDMFVSFGGIRTAYIIEAAPSEEILDGKKVKRMPVTRKNHRFIKLGAVAASLAVAVLVGVLLLNTLFADVPTFDSYADVLKQSDTVVFGTYKGKTEKLTYTEYVFEVTEVLKGEVTESEITVRSNKKTVFSEDEMEKHAQDVKSAFEEGVEYFLALELEKDEVLEFVTEQIIETANMVNAGDHYDELKSFLAENGVELNSTRNELKAFWEYVLGGIGANGEKNFTKGLQFTFDSSMPCYIVSQYYGDAENVVIPSVYNGFPVKEIGARVFENCETIKSVVISENIETIHDNAFKNCRNLQTVSIPQSLQVIGEAVFENCTNLLYYSENGANYLGCESNPKIILMSVDREDINYIRIDDATKIIYDGVFKDFKELKKVILPVNLSCLCKDSFGNSATASFEYRQLSIKWHSIIKHPKWYNNKKNWIRVQTTDCVVMF